jgi:hypothetical protein
MGLIEGQECPMFKKDAIIRQPEQNSARAMEGVQVARELFWQNVMREILTSLSVISTAGLSGKAEEHEDLFDGRLAVITQLGQRVPIAAVFPLFACGIDTSDTERQLSMAVECTVFQIRTPGGEVFTLPLHEIRAFHSLSEDLVEQIRKQAAQQSESEDDQEPFGFAAYTSLARTKLPSEAMKTPNAETGEASANQE